MRALVVLLALGTIARADDGVVIGAGASLLARRLTFDRTGAQGAAGGDLPGFRIDGAIYPLALTSDPHPRLAAFGLAGSYESTPRFTAHGPSGPIDASGSEFAALLVGRIHARRAGLFTVEAGYRRIVWASESSADLEVPNATYDLIDAGVRWQRALGTRFVEGTVRLAALALVDASGITDLDQYGAARGGGLDAELGLIVHPVAHIWIGVFGHDSALFLSFSGSGARLAHAAIDERLGGALEVGFAL